MLNQLACLSFLFIYSSIGASVPQMLTFPFEKSTLPDTMPCPLGGWD